MNDKLKALVEDLESGLHKQQQGRLRCGDAYCCLGRACAVADDTKWEGNGYARWAPDFPEEEYRRADYAHGRIAFYMPPVRVREAMGLTENQEQDLAQMNDAGKSFKEIAAKIRSWFPGEVCSTKQP